MTAYVVEPIRPNLSFGIQVTGLRHEDLAIPGVAEHLRDLWIQHGVIVFRGAETREFQLALSAIFGELIAHPAREARGDHNRLTTVRYRPDTGWLMSVDGELRGTWLPWHSDLIYVARINHGGILRPLKLPSRLGETGFIDKIIAYATLPDRLKAQIEHLSVIYKYDLDPAHQKFGRTNDVQMVRVSPDVLSIQSRLDDFPRVIHPMVYRQEGTGRKVLNVSPWYAMGIEGREDAAGDALLAEIIEHIVHAERYIHDWRPDDMVLWDNWRMLHSATGAPPDEERWMERTTIAGDYGLGRNEHDAQLDEASYISV